MNKLSYREMQSSWYLNTKAGEVFRKATGKIAKSNDESMDIEICGCSLAKDDNEVTSYYALDEIFEGYSFDSDEKIIDIGCETGRVLAYLEYNGFDGKLVGVETNEQDAEVIQKWTKEYDNISIISGDTFDFNCDDYTVFFVNRAFDDDEMYKKLIEKMEKELTHRAVIFSYVDNKITPLLKRRTDNWLMERRDYVFKKGAIAYSYDPNRFAIWSYIPN